MLKSSYRVIGKRMNNRRVIEINPSNSENSKPRVLLKHVAKSIKNVLKNVDLKAQKSRIMKDNVSVLSTNSVNNNGYKKTSRRGDSSSGNKTLPDENKLREGFCYKIHILNGKNYDQHTLIELLHNSIRPNVFIPIMYKKCGHDIVFYIDDFEIAKKLSSLDCKISTSDGFKIIIKVTQQNLSIDDISSKLNDSFTVNKIKSVISKRYVAEKNALDLSAFHRDYDLVSEYYIPLNRNNILTGVFDIISDTLPSITALNLDKNNFTTIHKMSILSSKFPNLKVLHIADNNISMLPQLRAIKSLQLEELKLTGNPVCMHYKNRHENYVRCIQNIFPKLIILDGVNLSHPGQLEKAKKVVQLPETKTGFAISLESYSIATQFFDLYFKCFDCESRQTLLVNAYNETANFSINVISTSSQMYRFDKYLETDQYMLQIKEKKLLKLGKTSIMNYLSSLPQTKHFPQSFTLDITLDTGNMIIMTATGLFQEINTKDKFIRFFSRTFVIVRKEAGWRITNEQFNLSEPTLYQEKYIFKSSQQQQQAQSSTTVSHVDQPSVESKQQMIMAFSTASNMKLEWSEKCLADHHWNYDNAFNAFQDFFKRGEIPHEAFNK